MTARDREAEVRRLRAAWWAMDQACSRARYSEESLALCEQARAAYLTESMVAEMLLHPLPLTEAEQAKEAMGRG